MAPTITDTILEDVMADVFVDLALINGTGSYFLDLDNRVYRYEIRPLEEGSPDRPYLCLGETRINPPGGLEEHPNNWEEWNIEFDLYLYVDIDKDTPNLAHRNLLLGLADVNRAIKVDEGRNELAGNTWISSITLDTVTSKETPLLKVAAMRMTVRISNLRTQRGDMTQR